MKLLMNTFREKPSADTLAIFLCFFTDKWDKKPQGCWATVMTQALLSVISMQTISQVAVRMKNNLYKPAENSEQAFIAGKRPVTDLFLTTVFVSTQSNE